MWKVHELIKAGRGEAEALGESKSWLEDLSKKREREKMLSEGREAHEYATGKRLLAALRFERIDLTSNLSTGPTLSALARGEFSGGFSHHYIQMVCYLITVE
jgi:hypothetical protein